MQKQYYSIINLKVFFKNICSEIFMIFKVLDHPSLCPFDLDIFRTFASEVHALHRIIIVYK